MREKLLKLDGVSCFECSYKDECGWEAENILCRMDVDNILTLIRTEIENVENPYMDRNPKHIDFEIPDQPQWDCFERCRQAVLNLFKGENETSTKETR